MPSPRNVSTFSSFTTICSGVCFENVLMVIHSARPQAAGTTQNNPLTTNGPKNPDPSRCNTHLSGVTPLSDEPNHSQGLNHTRALHPLRGAAPLTWRCTCYVAVHPNRRGVMPTDRVHCPLEQVKVWSVCAGVTVSHSGEDCFVTVACGLVCRGQAAGAAPVTWRCTRYVAVHPNRRGVMPTDRVHHHTNKPNRGYAHLPMGRHCTTGRVRTLLRVCLCGCGPGRSLLLGLA